MMCKIRHGFVSNSSSSSFIIISAGSKILIEDGDTSLEQSGQFSIPIEELIADLQAAQTAGATQVEIVHGGGYDS